MGGGRASYAALAVGRRDGPVMVRAWRAGQPADPPPRSAIASITKPILATAVLQLVEAGRLALVEPLSTYVPEFAPQPPGGTDGPVDPVSAWHILTHTSGLTDAPHEFFLSERPTRARLQARLCTGRLSFAPGSAYQYCSDSFYLLAELIERLSGLPYQEYLRTHIFEPLGMGATTFDPGDPGPPGLPIEGTLGPPGVPYEELVASVIELAMPGGGLWSVPLDILQFGRAMLNGGTLDGSRVLGQPFVSLMTRRHTADLREVESGRRPEYGLGWGRPGFGRGLPVSRSTFAHTGATGSMLVVDPEYDLVVVHLRNEWGAATTATDQALGAVYGAIDA